jgi:hypothetical protein
MSQGLYVEIPIRGELDRVWELTQTPHLHQRWDLRFSSITYLPKESNRSPQRFHYSTRIGFGLSITGMGESLATRTPNENVQISSLRFWSDERLSLIAEGNGYWKYVIVPDDTRIIFLTWYDYSTRYGSLGKILDMAFRPLLGWATAWSFDRLRMWIEDGCTPETTLVMTLIYFVARVLLSFVWIWHGLVPKLISRSPDELSMLHAVNLSSHWLPWIGSSEIALGTLGLIFWRWRGYTLVTAVLMIIALIQVVAHSPEYVRAAFNPVTLNACVFGLSAVAWCAWRYSAFAGRCVRRPPKRIV